MNYIELIATESTDVDEILYQFYLQPIPDEVIELYLPEVLSKVSTDLFSILKATKIEKIISILDKRRDEIPQIDTNRVPQLSNVFDADLIPGIVESNPGCTPVDIGYFFNKDASEDAQRKYGENHYKTAAYMRLTVLTTRNRRTTFLGKKYMTLSKEDRDVLRPRLCLCNETIQRLVVEGLHGKFDAWELYTKLFPKGEETPKRRRSSTQQMLKLIYEGMEDSKTIQSNLLWGYK